jgi:hypothetical protein
MKTKKQFGGRTRLAKKKAKFAKNAQVDMFPSFNQMYKYRSVLPIDKIKFLQKYKKNHKNTLSQEDMDYMNEDGDYWHDEESKQELIKFHKNTLILFMEMGRNSNESDFQFDEENVLDMNEPMTDAYLDTLRKKHDILLRYLLVPRHEKSYLERSYDEFETLKQIPRLFLLYWTGMNKGKSILDTKIAPELVDHTMSYVTRNDEYDKLFPSSKTKSRKSLDSQKSQTSI